MCFFFLCLRPPPLSSRTDPFFPYSTLFRAVVAIRTGHLSYSRLIGRRIGSRKLYVCATPDYLEKHGVPSDINDLKYHACIQGTADVWHFIVDDKLVDF